MVTFFADGKECQETDKIIWFVMLQLASSSIDVRWGEKYGVCWSFQCFSWAVVKSNEVVIGMLFCLFDYVSVILVLQNDTVI